MLLSKSQQNRFWRDWSAACRKQGWTATQSWTGLQIDNERHALLERAGFDSLTQVDPTTGFDRVLQELEALIHPDDLNRQLYIQENPKRQLIWRCRQHAKAVCDLSPATASRSEAYIRRIMFDRFKTLSMDDLSESQLLDLCKTLARCHSSARRRRSPRGPSSEISNLQSQIVDQPF